MTVIRMHGERPADFHHADGTETSHVSGVRVQVVR
jgi:hypothetical protein